MTASDLAHRLAPLVAILLIGAVGCRDDKTSHHEFQRDQTELTDSEHFEQAWYLLRQLEEFEPEQTFAQITYHLNRWLGAQGPANDWLRDSMLGDPSLGYLRQLTSLGSLDTLEFSTRDAVYLRECRWLRDIAHWVPECPAPLELRDWLAALPDRMGAENAAKLGIASRCFDWTIRNIQLDPFPSIPGAEKVERPAAESIPGPGYALSPWQALLLGHGDAWVRTRIFVLLLRQQAIDAVVLSTSKSDTEPATPWAIGVRIGKDLYLFDPALGLAIPGPGDLGIATLAELIDAPSLLRQMDIGETFPYRITEPELSRVVAWVDASSESLSQRMAVIEAGLTGDRRMALTTHPTAVKQRLADCRGITAVQIWKVPLEAELFSLAFEELRKRDSRVDSQYRWQMAMFSGVSPLAQARQLHFRRQFERDDEKPGSIVKYMETRAPEREIEQLAKDVERQRIFGLQRGPAESEEAWQARIAQGQQLLRTGKQHASYWLGIVHYEQGEYENAMNWFARRTLDESPDSPWTPGARYNLGRCHEALGKFAEAREQYLLDDSPQRHGNLLRSRWLRVHKLNDSSSGEETATRN